MCFTSGRSPYSNYRLDTVRTSQLPTVTSARTSQLPTVKRTSINQGMLAPFIGPKRPCGSCGGAR